MQGGEGRPHSLWQKVEKRKHECCSRGQCSKPAGNQRRRGKKGVSSRGKGKGSTMGRPGLEAELGKLPEVTNKREEEIFRG